MTLSYVEPRWVYQLLVIKGPLTAEEVYADYEGWEVAPIRDAIATLCKQGLVETDDQGRYLACL